MIIAIIILIVLALVYINLPLVLKLVIMVINAFLPDPIPVLDEVFMTATSIGHLMKAVKVQAFIEKYKALSIIIAAAIVCLIVYGIWFIIAAAVK